MRRLRSRARATCYVAARQRDRHVKSSPARSQLSRGGSSTKTHAVRARCDDVLDDARASGASTDEFDAEEKRKRDEKAKAAGGTSKGYSSKKEWQREETARRKKEMMREEVRRRRQEAEAAGAAGAAAAQASP